MRVLGLIPEPPYEPKSWSGSAAPFFHALSTANVLASAAHVRLSASRELIEKSRVISWPMARWKERYHASVPRFSALTASAGSAIAAATDIDATLQIGAWFSSGTTTSLPCFSYHDGNAAQWYRFYGRGLLCPERQAAHLEWERDVYSRLTGIFVMSSWLASSFISDFGVSPDKLHVVGAGMNIKELPALPERDYSKARFLFVGKDFTRKGGEFLLRAFREVRKDVVDAELVIVGPDLSIDEPGVVCAGFLSKSDTVGCAKLHDLFTTATALVLPSIYEPFGISLTEGMAYGLPCIATDRCAMPEIVQHGETGLVVPVADVSLLARAMLELATNPVAAAAMGAKGRRRAENEFTWGAVAQKMKNVLLHRYRIV